ncbi:MAG TPA: hypothetical protein VHX39_22090 [Acetobacteraceae bacterium]|jgi:thymidylate kinase|nr:hypothetical protein [Acetobacteraceae bacterium]
MASVLVSGGPGAGKSSVAEGLRHRGLQTIDSDYGLARWEDLEGAPATMPAAPDLEWLRHHRWQWIGEQFERVLRECHERPAVICGAAYNMADYLPRFDLLILLQIDAATMVRRLAHPGRNNDWGKAGATLEWSFNLRRRQEAALLEAGAVCVDGRQPAEHVLDQIARICSGHEIDLSDN